MNSIAQFILKKFFNPCKTCLVKVICLDQCPSYEKYCDRTLDVELLIEDVEWWITKTILYICLLLIITTFGFGIWKHIELIF